MERFHDLGCKKNAHEQGIWGLQAIPSAYSEGVGNFITGGGDGELRTWVFNTASSSEATPPVSEVSCFTRHSLPIVHVAVASKRPFAASTSLDGTVKLWDLSEKSDGKTLQSLKATDTWDVAITSEAEKVVTAGVDGVVTVMDNSLNNTSETFNMSGEKIDARNTSRTANPMVMSLALSWDDQKLALGAQDGSVGCLDMATGKVATGGMAKHGGAVRTICFLPGEPNTIVTGSDDQLINFYDVRTGHVTGSCSGHEGLVLCVNGREDGKYVVSGSSDRSVRIWDRVMKESVYCYKRHEESVWGVCYGGDRVVSVGDDCGVCVIDGSKADSVS